MGHYLIFFYFVQINPALAKDKLESNAEVIKLHMLGNSELIKKIRDELKNASDSFLSQLRGVSRSEMQFDFMKSAYDEIEIPVEEVPEVEGQ